MLRKTSHRPLAVCEEMKYLGHVISDDYPMTMCSLFRTYITPLSTAQLWSNYKKKSMHRLQVAYHDAMRVRLCVPSWHSASQLFVSTRVPTCEALLRQVMFSCMCRLDKSENHIIEALVSPLKSFFC